jgi:hypothetical protein
MEFFYDLSLTPSEKKRILGLEEYVISPAEMGKLLFEHFEEYSKVLETLELKKNNSPSSAQIIQLFHRFLNKSTREERMHELKSLEFTPSEMGQVIIDYFEEFKDTLVNVEYGKALVSMKETQTESQSLHVEYREYNEIPELSDISEFSDEDHTLNPYERYTGPGSFLK